MCFILKLSEILTSESTPSENRQKLFQQIVLFEQILITEGWSSHNIFLRSQVKMKYCYIIYTTAALTFLHPNLSYKRHPKTTGAASSL